MLVLLVTVTASHCNGHLLGPVGAVTRISLLQMGESRDQGVRHLAQGHMSSNLSPCLVEQASESESLALESSCALTTQLQLARKQGSSGLSQADGLYQGSTWQSLSSLPALACRSLTRVTPHIMIKFLAVPTSLPLAVWCLGLASPTGLFTAGRE